MENFKPNDCSVHIIAHLYPEVPLHTRINNKGLMLPQLACNSTPGIYLHLKNKYLTKNENGEYKQLSRRFSHI